MDNLAKALLKLANTTSKTDALDLLLGYSMTFIKPDLAAYYRISGHSDTFLKLVKSKGRKLPFKSLKKDQGINFVLESGETLAVLNIEEPNTESPNTKENFFSSILLDPSMRGGICTPLINSSGNGGIVLLNFALPYQFNFDHIELLETLVSPVISKGDY